eukprot:3699448-Prymnesium_polylepis.2
MPRTGWSAADVDEGVAHTLVELRVELEAERRAIDALWGSRLNRRTQPILRDTHTNVCGVRVGEVLAFELEPAGALGIEAKCDLTCIEDGCGAITRDERRKVAKRAWRAANRRRRTVFADLVAERRVELGKVPVVRRERIR